MDFCEILQNINVSYSKFVSQLTLDNKNNDHDFSRVKKI